MPKTFASAQRTARSRLDTTLGDDLAYIGIAEEWYGPVYESMPLSCWPWAQQVAKLARHLAPELTVL